MDLPHSLFANSYSAANSIGASRLHLDIYRASPATRKRVRDRIEEQIGEHLTIWSRKAVHDQIGCAVDREREALFSQTRLQAHDNLFGQIGEVENPLIGIIPV